ncbi:F-box protein CPR1-like [Coffea eugenioides]|uniref:F-box protein CPR1-like n=1 Tax=Coffea eugenioides TaxID=49369 RepID=UPI000F608771|nr:F-box protein CPR1-like [Coffea eugenioides]
MSDYIPDHLLAHVLLRLPFDSLLRSRCVSKSWHALIDCSGFIKMHLSKANQEANSPNGIKIIALNQDKLYTSDLDLEAHSSSTSVLLQVPNSSAALLIITLDTALGTECTLFDCYALGCGYDRVNDDYKVVNRICIADLFDEDPSSWRDKVSAYDCYRAPDCILANGALHWFTRERKPNDISYIISFDLSSEEFRKLPCPMYLPDSIYQNLRILNGRLCLVTYHKVASGRYVADLWAMEEYGVEKSWTKLTSVTIPSGLSFRILTPLALSKNKSKLVLQIHGEKLVIHDLETKCTSDSKS